VNAARDELKAVKLPADLEPDVTYAAGVVKGAEQPEKAREFVAGLTDGGCANALEQAGFGAP
jgi:ABC-type molybdate transport system substrate-binding protein